MLTTLLVSSNQEDRRACAKKSRAVYLIFKYKDKIWNWSEQFF